ncbi:MAG: host attachment protein [Gammaproteobacteria bacterium]|nr:MAG: host attachment protein [Gammaproteobacteria bacterium]
MRMSNSSCVVVCAGGNARLFTLEPAELPELESGPNLVACGEVTSEEVGVHGAALWSDLKTGRNRSPGGSAHGYDDHRDRHAEEYDRRFAQEVAEQTRRLVDSRQLGRVVLVAHGHCLAHLRQAFHGRFRNGTSVAELSKDLGKLKPLEIHAHLARERLLPERSGPRRLAS